jgi:subtilisin-like proprotein convertase family protein
MRRTFRVAPALDVPDGSAGARSQIAVYGLATVDMDVSLRASIRHERAADLRVALVNPTGTRVAIPTEGGVWEGGLDLELAVEGFSGDEAVNGIWTLEILDRAAGQTGVLDDWALTVGSRWD